MRDEPNWALILQMLHDGEAKGWDYNGNDAEEWADYLDIGSSRAHWAINYLEQANLITEDTDGGYLLTPRGFDIAHEREMSRQKSRREDQRIRSQNKVNSAIGFLTLGLLFATYAHTVLTVGNYSTTVTTIGLATDGIIVAGVSLLLLQTGLLTPEDRIN